MSTATKPQTPPHGAPVEPKRRWGWLVLAVVVIGAVAAGLYYRAESIKSAQASAEKANAVAEESPGGSSSDDAVSVATVRLSRGGIMRVSTQIGTVHPYEGADLYAKVSGYLSKLHVDYGDHVKRDQLLVEIDDPEVVEDAKKAAADVLQAKAAEAQAEAFIESAKADRDASASAVEQAVADVDRYVSMRSYHQKKYARYQDLVAKNAIPQNIADEEEESYESARAAEISSQKAVLHSRAELMAAKARVKKAEADLKEAQANVEVAEAKKAAADVLVGYTKIHSPYNGVIIKRNFFRGDFIRSASDGNMLPLLTVYRTDKVRVVTNIPDRDVPVTNVGDDAEITLDALPGQTFKGKVSRYAEAEDPASRTMHTEIDLPNPDDKLRVGMYGIAKVILDTSAKSATLPASCLVGESKDGNGEVYIIKKGKARKVKVAIGADDGLRVEILSGLSPDDEVIASTGSVTEGTPVRPAPPLAENTNEKEKHEDNGHDPHTH